MISRKSHPEIHRKTAVEYELAAGERRIPLHKNPRCDAMVMGLPCSGHARRYKGVSLCIGHRRAHKYRNLKGELIVNHVR